MCSLTPTPRQARAVVQAQYALTQRHLSERGITEVAMSRGMWFPSDSPTPEWVPARKGGSPTS